MSWFIPWLCCGSLSEPRIEPYRTGDVPHLVPPERIDEPFLASLESPVRTMFRQRLQMDMRLDPVYYPTVMNSSISGRNYQRTFFGFFELGEILTQNFRSVVFEVDDSNTVIKYSHNCDAYDFVHPLVMSAWIGGKAGTAGIGPRINTLSPPRKMTVEDFSKFGFIMSEESARRCAGASLRYLVMSRPSGSTIASQNRFGLSEAIRVSREIFASLKLMKELGLVHGALSEHNVVVDRAGNVQLINFGDFAGDEILKMSPWEIQRAPYSFRDDVFRAIRILAAMINGVERYTEYEKSVFERFGISGTLQWKLERNFFFIPATPDRGDDPIIRAIGEDNRPLIRGVTRSLNYFVSLVFLMGENPADIPYDDILECLEAIEKKLQTNEESVSMRFASFTN